MLVFNLIKKYRKFGLNLSNLVFMQIESPLRKNDFFIKKVCLGAKNKKKIIVGNLNIYRDYSWITDIVKAITLTSNLKSKDYIISAGRKLSGIEIIKTAYNINKLDYKKYMREYRLRSEGEWWKEYFEKKTSQIFRKYVHYDSPLYNFGLKTYVFFKKKF